MMMEAEIRILMWAKQHQEPPEAGRDKEGLSPGDFRVPY